MATPTLQKSYEFAVNQIINTGVALDDHREFLLAIKNSLIGFTNVPWTVAGSADGTIGAMDAVDRWTTGTDIVWNNAGINTGSWIVFNTQAGRQILLFMGTTLSLYEYTGMTMWISPGGLFTGGTGNTRPTATDEYGIQTGNTPWLDGATGPSPLGYALHLIHSTDGEVTHVIGGRAGYTQFWLADIKLQNPVAGWSHPYVFRWEPGVDETTNRMTYAANRDAQIWHAITTALGGGTSFLGAASCEGWGSSSVGQQFVSGNDFTGEWLFLPAGFASNSVAGMGRHGVLPDMWYGSAGLNTGDTLENNLSAPTRQFVQFSHIVLPWNGSIPRTR